MFSNSSFYGVSFYLHKALLIFTSSLATCDWRALQILTQAAPWSNWSHVILGRSCIPHTTPWLGMKFFLARKHKHTTHTWIKTTTTTTTTTCPDALTKAEASWAQFLRCKHLHILDTFQRFVRAKKNNCPHPKAVPSSFKNKELLRSWHVEKFTKSIKIAFVEGAVFQLGPPYMRDPDECLAKQKWEGSGCPRSVIRNNKSYLLMEHGGPNDSRSLHNTFLRLAPKSSKNILLVSWKPML